MSLPAPVWRVVITGVIVSAIIIASVAAEHLYRRRQRKSAEHDARALFITCDPCHDKPGKCHCPEPCGNPHCTGRGQAVSRG